MPYPFGHHQISFFYIIKPTRCINFPNIFCHETLHVSDSSSVYHQEFIHCTVSNGIYHTGVRQLSSRNRMEKKAPSGFFFMRTNQEYLKTKCERNANILTGKSADAAVNYSLMCAILYSIVQYNKIINWKSLNFACFLLCFTNSNTF
jgi:hypothetical protein